MCQRIYGSKIDSGDGLECDVIINTNGSSPEAFGDYLKSELVKWGALVKSSGLKVD